MKQQDCFIKYIEQSIINNWDLNALTDYNGETFQYKDVARKIAKIHLLFEEAGIKKGDKVAVCGRNSSFWAVAVLATITYGGVAVPVLHEFKADNIHNIVNHSEARFMFVGDQVWENLNEELMPNLEGIIVLNTFELVVSRSEKLSYAHEHLNALYGKKYPRNFRPHDISYRKDSPEELAVINYTSGTTGFSKGVMLPYRSLTSNVEYCWEKHPIGPEDNLVGILPMGHIFGMVYDFLYGICAGAHVYYLTRMPSPKIIAQSFSEIKPKLISCVPLIVEKIIKKNILPRFDNRVNKILLQVPIVNEKLKASIRQEAMDAFGGNFDEIIIGGAPLNGGIESLLRTINFPYTIAYGMTECAPIIASSHWSELKQKCCGKAASRMEVAVVSENPESTPGELICKGENMMLGYYKNEEATKGVIDENGWLHTGDMAVMDKEGNISIKGRCKNLLMNASGQNIYPEEIESVLNNMPYVSESIIVMQNEKLVALIYPDYDDAFANGLSNEDIEKAMETNRASLNQQLPGYSQISKVKLHPEEFEKTAKKSIKRFMYQDIQG